MIIVTQRLLVMGTSRLDTTLCRRLQDALSRQPWFATLTAQVFVADGRVTVEGLATDETARAVCMVARQVAGADRVDDAIIRIDAIGASGLLI